MESAETMEARHGRMLARLAELSLGLAEEVQAQAVAAEAPDEQARLAHAFARVAYAARQCIALEAKLVRDAERARDLAAGRAEVRRAAGREQRAGQIRLSLGRAVAVESVGYERDDRLRDVDRLVTEGLLYDRFADAPLEEQIAALCEHLGLDPDEVADLSPFLDAPDADDDPGEDEEPGASDSALFDAAEPPETAWRGTG